MSTITTTATAHDGEHAEGRTRASIAVGRERGYYRVLFDSGPVTVAEFARLAGMHEERAGAWIAEQLDAEVLRTVPSSIDGEDGEPELLLPGEHVPILLGDRGEAEFSGARAMLAERRNDVAPVIAAMLRT